MHLRVLLVVATFLMASVAVAQPPDHAIERVYDASGRLIVERGLSEHVEGLAYERHYWHADAAAKPDNPGGGKGKGGGDDGGDPGTDCSSNKYALAGWHWTSPYSASASSHAAVFHASLQTWQASTSAAVAGAITFGDAATAGVQDFVNQIDFVHLGSTSTIAVTTTWYYTATGEAVESDAQYNLAFAWATDGSADAMDIQAIATHEIGHTLGLDHPKGNPRQTSCLTMYAYGSEGSTIERSLGDGDILGIQALYGA